MQNVEERIQKLEDEAAIRDLAAAFADATSRDDKAEYTTSWKKNGVFTIGAPLTNVCNGVEEILAFISKLRDDKEFFVQFVHSGVVAVNGDHATARWLVEEVAREATSITTTMVCFLTRSRKSMVSGFLQSALSITCIWIFLRSRGTPTLFLIRYLAAKEAATTPDF